LDSLLHEYICDLYLALKTTDKPDTESKELNANVPKIKVSNPKTQLD